VRNKASQRAKTKPKFLSQCRTSELWLDLVLGGADEDSAHHGPYESQMCE
jgi:hypothetical protein